jgi:phage tail-like protein
MRGLVEGLPNPHPIGVALPAVFQEDDFSLRLASAFDDVLAPVVSTLDNAPAYLDPTLTPSDFLEWLAGWVGAVVDENWPLERQRTFVAEAVELYRWRGTVKGLSALVTLYAGVEPEIVDTGGVSWSAMPNGRVPGEPEPRMTIRLRVPDRSAVNVDRLDAIVRAAKPAHVPHQIELTGPGREPAKEPPKGGGGEPPKPGQVPPAKPEPTIEETPQAEAEKGPEKAEAEKPESPKPGNSGARPKNGNSRSAKASEPGETEKRTDSPNQEG